ncbi:hypothetical protein POTOM_005977 [Populus tomentosa]|uniref:Disease resistance R13L4/SHOC-2-like LRR domain-containing protein n=1 Tax=Populus tomentosa TaxID=118781 RepID=A0A8X8DEU2_POPTO|nr:hypothetical protein POTOM_005977 [Populus tomentosa]
MGNFCSISISCDELLSGCLDFTFRKAVYISKLEENVDGLKIAVEGLTDLKNDVTRRVKVEEEQQLKRLDQVQRWISRAEAAKVRANELLGEGSQEIERLCLGGYCSKNYKSSYRFAKEVDKMLRDVADLKANGDFDVVAEKVPAASGVPRPSEPTVGLESTFNQNKSLDEKAVDIFNALRRKRGFFQFMPNLTVLDLSNNISLLGLPRGVWKLVSLQYLNLSRTGIKELPTELNELVKLRYLNLEYTHSLYLLPHGVISCFPMMRILRMFRCGSSEQAAEDCILSRDESLVEELQCLEKLNMLTVTIRSAAALERLSSFQGLQSSTRVLYLELFHDSKLVNFSSLANMKNLDTLHICHCGSLEELQIDWEGELQKMQAINNLAQVATTERPFRSLSSVYVENCLKLSNLTWLILAQNLTFLSLSNCPKLVDVASVEKLPEVPELVENLNPFAKLKAVELVSLPNLKSFYWIGLPLPSVKDVRVVDCPFLDKRPLDASRASQ